MTFKQSCSGSSRWSLLLKTVSAIAHGAVAEKVVENSGHILFIAS